MPRLRSVAATDQTPSAALSASIEAAPVVAWYDNEWGYSNRLVDLSQRVLARCLRRSEERSSGDREYSRFRTKRCPGGRDGRGRAVLVALGCGRALRQAQRSSVRGAGGPHAATPGVRSVPLRAR